MSSFHHPEKASTWSPPTVQDKQGHNSTDHQQAPRGPLLGSPPASTKSPPTVQDEPGHISTDSQPVLQSPRLGSLTGSTEPSPGEPYEQGHNSTSHPQALQSPLLGSLPNSFRSGNLPAESIPSKDAFHRVEPNLSEGPSRGSPRANSPNTNLRCKQALEWKSTVAEDPWTPCFLALDGGGIRGFSSALILQRLMQKIHAQELAQEAEYPIGDPIPDHFDLLLPCHYFDYMFGTSTGGLIAIMLARLRMSIGECIEQYRIVGDRLFGHKKNIIPMMTKYRSRPLVTAVKALVETKKLGYSHPWDNDVNSIWDPYGQRVCQSCCLTAIHDGSIQRAHLLRSYNHRPSLESIPEYTILYNAGADPLDIWQVTRATSAAPMYFDMLEAVVDGELRGHKDGGIRENNPAGAAWAEFCAMYAKDDDNAEPAVLLSIGTGRTKSESDGFMSALPWPWGILGRFKAFRKLIENLSVIPNLVVKYTASEGTHDMMKTYARGEHTWYKRLNVSEGMDNMPLDSWSKGLYQGQKVPGGASLQRMYDATQNYLERDLDRRYEGFAAPKELLDHVAEKVVRVRRARRRLGGPRWAYFIGEGLHERMANA